MKNWIRKPKPVNLILAFFVMLGAWGFLEIADEVMDEETTSIDESILLSLREPEDTSDPIGAVWVEEGARDITALGSFVVLFLLSVAVAAFLLLTGKRRAALILALAVVTGAGMSSLLKGHYDRARPDLVAHQMHVLTPSFPSGHSMVSTLTYLSLGFLLASTQPKKRVKTFIILFSVTIAVLVGLSRLYLGVHWPTDVLAGWFAGAAWATLWWIVARVTLPREETEKSGLEAEEPPQSEPRHEGA